jgi:cyclic di-GMP phosphodiesterase Gmr
MYHRELNVQILTRNKPQYEWEFLLQKVAPPERFSCRFSTAIPEAADGDVLILADHVTDDEAAALAQRKKPDGAIVLCRTAEQLQTPNIQTLELMDRVWTIPMADDLLTYEFSSLLKELQERTEKWVCQNCLDSLIDSVPELIWFKDVRGAHLKVNDSFCQAVNKTKEQIHGRGHYYIWDITPTEYTDGEYICLESEKEVLARRETCQFDERVKTKHGLRQFHTYKTPVFDRAHQEILGTIGIAHDVTDLKNITSELRLVFKSIPFALVICDEHWSILNVNQQFESYFGQTQQSLSGTDYHIWKCGALDDGRVSDRDGYYEALSRKNGNCYEFFEQPILDIFGDTAGYLCFYMDVTLERKYRRELQRYATCDPLTGLYNRRYFYEEIGERRAGQPLTLFYIDVDNFKLINDCLSHEHGDRVLCSVALEIHNAFPTGFAVRMGGDEFVVALIGKCDRQELAESAEALLERICMQKNFDAHTPELSVSIGIAYSGDPEVSTEILTYRSDAAMYHAKRGGKSQYCFYEPNMELERDGSYPEVPKED